MTTFNHSITEIPHILYAQTWKRKSLTEIYAVYVELEEKLCSRNNYIYNYSISYCSLYFTCIYVIYLKIHDLELRNRKFETISAILLFNKIWSIFSHFLNKWSLLQQSFTFNSHLMYISGFMLDLLTTAGNFPPFLAISNIWEA